MPELIRIFPGKNLEAIGVNCPKLAKSGRGEGFSRPDFLILGVNQKLHVSGPKGDILEDFWNLQDTDPEIKNDQFLIKNDQNFDHFQIWAFLRIFGKTSQKC